MKLGFRQELISLLAIRRQHIGWQDVTGAINTLAMLAVDVALKPHKPLIQMLAVSVLAGGRRSLWAKKSLALRSEVEKHMIAHGIKLAQNRCATSVGERSHHLNGIADIYSQRETFAGIHAVLHIVAGQLINTRTLVWACDIA